MGMSAIDTWGRDASHQLLIGAPGWADGCDVCTGVHVGAFFVRWAVVETSFVPQGCRSGHSWQPAQVALRWAQSMAACSRAQDTGLCMQREREGVSLLRMEGWSGERAAVEACTSGFTVCRLQPSVSASTTAASTRRGETGQGGLSMEHGSSQVPNHQKPQQPSQALPLLLPPIPLPPSLNPLPPCNLGPRPARAMMTHDLIPMISHHPRPPTGRL